MKDTFQRHDDVDAQRLAYLRHLSDTATFVGTTWEPQNGASRQLAGLPAGAMTDTVKLCLAFLTSLNHTVAIPPLLRFYSEAIHAEEGEARDARIVEFEQAIKAVTAFTTFWRATRRGTGNIDSQYRSIMAGDSITGIGPLARNWQNADHIGPKPEVNVEAFKSELVARLSDPRHGGIPNLATFVAVASSIPLYTTSKPLTRFLLLAAYHDTIEDPTNPGLITAGKAGVSPCFTSEGWSDEPHFSIEHIAPQQRTEGWDDEFYGKKESVHQLGNLILAPGAANSSLSSRPWEEKRVLYRALGATSADEAKTVLNNSGLTFAQSTEELAAMSRYLPHLRALGQRTDAWDPAFMDRRGEVLLGLVYSRLKDWLGLNWSESAEDPIAVISSDVDAGGDFADSPFEDNEAII